MMRRIVRRSFAAAAWDGMHPVLARVYSARGVVSMDELDHSLARLPPPNALKGIEAAVDLLEHALRHGRRIVIVADYDADGATSCAVAMRGLRMLGGQDLRYVVPNRFVQGYGLTPEIVAVAAEERPDLLITVDNGIASVEGVAEANRRGIPVLITDHHLPAGELPAAAAIVNPNQPGCIFPCKHLAGVGVMFYVLLALRARLRQRGAGEVNLAQLLDLVALGTVADVVRLDHTNRILVAQGLRRMRAGVCHAGIRALARVAGRSLARLRSSDLGYALGPRLNAAGRLTDMRVGIECLLADDDAAAAMLAAQLDALNRERRAIQEDMQDRALEALAAGSEGALPRALSVFGPDWHQGVIGVLAGRLKERYHRPVIAFARGGPGELKGSARSVPGLNIRDTLDAVATRYPGLIKRFGGHAMAAGLTLDEANLERFGQAFADQVTRELGPAELLGSLDSDGEISCGDLTTELAREVEEGGPWGQGYPEPIFDGEFEVRSARIVAERHLRVLLRPLDGSLVFDAIGFGMAEHALPARGERLRAAYRLGTDDYRGPPEPRLLLEALLPP